MPFSPAPAPSSSSPLSLPLLFSFPSVVNVYILKPKTDPKQRNPLPTIKDVTILDPGKRENSVTLRSFKNIVFEYTFQKIYADNRKRIQSRRDAEIVRIKKAMLKIYLEVRREEESQKK